MPIPLIEGVAEHIRHSCESRNPVAEFVILHSVAGRRMIKSVLDQLLCSGYLLLFRLRMHSQAGAKEACHMGVLVVAFFWIPVRRNDEGKRRNDEGKAEMTKCVVRHPQHGE